MKKSTFLIGFGLLLTQIPFSQAVSFWDPWERKSSNIFDDSFLKDFEKTMEDRLSMMGSSTIINEDKITLTFDIPGLSKADVTVSIEQENVLVIKGEKKKICDKKDKEGESHYKSTRSFYKSMTLPKNAEIKKITAEVKDGVLTIIIPKSPASSEAVHTVSVQ